jgi:hypothetical protein
MSNKKEKDDSETYSVLIIPINFTLEHLASVIRKEKEVTDMIRKEEIKLSLL